MNKGCPWILLLLITANAATLTSCVGYNSEGRLPIDKRRIFLRPLLNDEYIPPLPIRHPTQFRNNRHNDHAALEETHDIALNRRSWIPLIYADELPTSAREMYVRPLRYSGRFSVKASSPVAVTKKPETFDIPLRKSIRVSHNVPREPSIQTTGYIKEVVVKKVPVHRLTPKPKYTILVDNVKQTTAHSAVNITPFEDGWRPKRITTFLPNVKATKASRRLKPVPFTQFSDSRNLGKKEKNNKERPSFNSESIKTLKPDSGISQDQNIQTNKSFGLDGSYTKFAGEKADGKYPYFVQSVDNSNRENKSDDALLSDPNILNHKTSDFESTKTNDNFRGTGRNKIFIGVEYADSELHGVKHDTSHEANANNNNDTGGNTVKSIDQEKKNPIMTNNKLKNGNSEMPSDVLLFDPHDGEKSSRYIKPNEEKKTHIHQTIDKSKSSIVKSHPGKEEDAGKQNMKESEIIDLAQPSSLAPYTDIHNNNNKLSLKEYTEDTIYFPPIIPDSRRILGKNITSTVKSTSIASTKAFVNNERLIEYDTKQANNTIASNHADSHRREHNRPKSETTNNFISHSYHSPTPPSLITVGSDNADFHHPHDPKRTRSKTNKTDTYVLQMKPSLFPDKPGNNRPRKPNIKITSAMLAGILIAALIFLGFLTGTYFILIRS
ncbi:unnamed protein product [Larinioides sclopetarius]|uniref:Uncharacterized protein n=1 Tax=Larinioides sclopetarius TaxID=280406 RepID=A0AAV2AKR1_9ARAC